MGFPLHNNYSLLRALAFGPRSDYSRSNPVRVEREEYLAISKSLRNFNLFAFVIHDPEEDKDFHENLNTIFERLDHSTGEHLLFFTLTNPPEKWHRKAAQREYYKQFSKIEFQQEGDLFGRPIVSSDAAETAYTLATAMQIPVDVLPVVVVTNDFRKDDFKWFRTSEHTIEKQLNELGFLASDYPEVRTNWKLAESLLDGYQDKFDLNHASGALTATGSLAKALSDSLSFIVVASQSSESHYKTALDQAKSTIQDLYRALTQMKKANEGARISLVDTGLFEQLNLNIVNFLSLLSTKSTASLDDILTIERRYLERETFHLLATARKVLDLFDRQDMDVQKMLGEEIIYDYTAVGICLTKLFEKEINLSLVHWIRKELGVSLPGCFNKFDNRANYATYTPAYVGLNNPRPIHFNNRKNGTNNWLAPGMGESKLCFASMLSDPSFSGKLDVLTAKEAHSILPKWEKISELRNACAHTNLIARSHVESIIHLLRELNSLGLFEKAYRMKQSYRN